ncbi:MAG: ABC transporter permease [Candidatus Omnitrophica bacterium]|nr:ABC transporter permease [Candidatus Omnitrophota bacterium]
MRRVFAFLKKDFLQETSYRLSFFLNILGIFFNLLSYFFIDKLFGHTIVRHLEPFGVNYFAYVLLSSAFFGYAGVGLGAFSDRLRLEQQQGTLEAIVATPTRISVFLFSLVLWNLIIATVDLIIYLLLAVFLFRIDFQQINIVSCAVILFLTITSFSGLGILSASFVMITKRANPLSWLIGTLEGLLGGVYFPITVLPFWLQICARLFPITYAIEAIQSAVYKNYSLEKLLPQIFFLFFFSITLLPFSILMFDWAIRRVQKDGSLCQY